MGTVPIKLTNLLGNVLGSYDFTYNPAVKSIQPVVPKEKFYAWEAQLAQCSCLSRAVYCPSEVFLRVIQFLDYPPDVVNDVITQLERSLYLRNNFKDLFISKNIPPGSYNGDHGMFFPKTGCAIFQHHNPSSKINNRKTLYVVFKGSSSFRDFMSDAKVVPINLKDIPQLSNLKGFTHYGFYKHMKDEVSQILNAVTKYERECEQVYVTGHSLGGAMASIFSLMAVNKAATSKRVHCVTFGAPNLFSDDARNEFNSFLLSGKLTFDRVTAMSAKTWDIIVTVPGVRFSHPGFGILKTELYATSKTGRAKNIDDTRSVFLGPQNVIKQNANELPADPVFWNLFLKWSPEETDIRKFQTGAYNRLKNVKFLEFALRDIKPTQQDIMPDMTPAEEAAEQKAMQQETAGVEKLVGGGIFTSEGKDIYAKQTGSQYPNQVNYECDNKRSAGFCHAYYNGVQYLGAVRAPTIRGVGIVRKLEPDTVTVFKSVSADMNPTTRYYAVAAAGGRRKTRRRIKPARKTRRLRFA